MKYHSYHVLLHKSRLTKYPIDIEWVVLVIIFIVSVPIIEYFWKTTRSLLHQKFCSERWIEMCNLSLSFHQYCSYFGGLVKYHEWLVASHISWRHPIYFSFISNGLVEIVFKFMRYCDHGINSILCFIISHLISEI